jgi:hypothetical protein
MAGSMMDQAIYKVVEQLVNSADGIKRAVRATNDGQPALAGVDALLRRELGSEYVRANNGTWWAGFAVAQLMRDMGFVEAGTGKCPSDCVAGQGTVWKPKVAAD